MEGSTDNKTSLDLIIGQALQIPSAPDLLPRLMKSLDDPQQTGEELSALIELDPGIASATLRLANSTWFGGRGQCDNLREAIFRLGAKEVFRITATSLTLRWIEQGRADGNSGWDPADFCRHSLSVAIASRLVAQEMSGVDEMKAYTAGLMHDIGKLVLASAVPERLAEVRAYLLHEGGSWRAAEYAVLGFDHTVVSAALMQKWGFPESLVTVCRYYPTPSKGPAEYFGLLAAVHAGKHLAVSLGVGVGEEGFLTEIDIPFLGKEKLDTSLGERILPAMCDELGRLLGGTLYIGRIGLGDLGTF